VSRATEVYSREFDSVFFKLPLDARELVEDKIADLGSDLSRFPHHRLQGRSEYRLRAGVYRVIYEFDRQKNILYLIAIGHRREVYKS
jgi:mRNA interferase RelE/StbE